MRPAAHRERSRQPAAHGGGAHWVAVLLGGTPGFLVDQVAQFLLTLHRRLLDDDCGPPAEAIPSPLLRIPSISPPYLCLYLYP
uniref:Uncharacterized protein n=1 Tax=Oryza sativa subsp. japonica TaxID=39947 RepID=Q67UY8_ORYSJ|nr:hypothetical protein [Oryza sativa Japonica Group]